MTSLFEQRGDTLPAPLQGHEHFGFKDGVSQPALRGQLAETGELLSPRFLAKDDPRFAFFARPGQPLLWPGQLLLGEPRQDPQDPVEPAPAATTFPEWARRGSYLVCRRLAQDVEGFWDFVASAAEEAGMAPVTLASHDGGPVAERGTAAALTGRATTWRWPATTSPTTTSCSTTTPARRGSCPSMATPGTRTARAKGDVFGRVCPHAAHIRKVNPRDSATDFGAPADTFLRLMLRRGIPYGPPIAGVSDPEPELVERRARAGVRRLHEFDRGPVRVRLPAVGELGRAAQPRRASTRSSASATRAAVVPGRSSWRRRTARGSRSRSRRTSSSRPVGATSSRRRSARSRESSPGPPSRDPSRAPPAGWAGGRPPCRRR